MKKFLPLFLLLSYVMLPNVQTLVIAPNAIVVWSTNEKGEVTGITSGVQDPNNKKAVGSYSFTADSQRKNGHSKERSGAYHKAIKQYFPEAEESVIMASNNEKDLQKSTEKHGYKKDTKGKITKAIK